MLITIKSHIKFFLVIVAAILITTTITEAAKKAGALGALLSGGGPTVLAFTTDREMTIGYEMADAAKVLGVSGEIMMLKPDVKGPKISAK